MSSPTERWLDLIEHPEDYDAIRQLALEEAQTSPAAGDLRRLRAALRDLRPTQPLSRAPRAVMPLIVRAAQRYLGTPEGERASGDTGGGISPHQA